MKLDPEYQLKAWHIPSKEIIFGISSDTTILSLSDLPLQAKEIKAHIYIHSGNVPDKRYVSWYFSTLFDAAKIQCYLYPQQAIAVSNEIVTFLLDDRGIIEVKRNGDFPSTNFYITFEIMLYR